MAFALAFDLGLAGSWEVRHPDVRIMASKRQMVFSGNRITREYEITASQSNFAEELAVTQFDGARLSPIHRGSRGTFECRRCRIFNVNRLLARLL
jgi:hypothetical protein